MQKTPLITLDLSQKDQLGELIPGLNQHPYLLLHPNFDLHYKDQNLGLYKEIGEQFGTEVSDIDIKIVLKGFDHFTCKQHVISCAKFFCNPDYFLYEKFLDFNVTVGKIEYLQQVIYGQEIKSVNKSVNLEKMITGDIEIQKKVDFLDKDSSKIQLNNKALFLKKLKYSEFNPPLGDAELQGDLLYLDFISLEGENFCITLNKNGCFRNGSNEKEFDRMPKTHTYFSILDLLGELSPLFKQDLNKFYNPEDPKVILTHSQSFKIIQPSHPTDQFYYTNQPTSLRNRLLMTLIDILEPDTHGFNLTFFRDWNEEFHNFLSLPTDNLMVQIQRTKILHKLQQQFIEASKKLSKAIFQNTIKPLNPSDMKSENCYVFNQLFATYAVDSQKWDLPKTDSSPSTYSTVNNDIKNLQQLYSSNIEGVNTINTCSVDFLCQRVVVQTVIQGILHFDQKTWGVYGSIDDGKTMCFTEEFHRLMEKVCKNFGISLARKFKDEQGKEFVFHGSPEVKGIKAGDGRQYMMDLMRLSPRDTNFPDVNEHECCIMRNELVKNYLFVVNLQKQYAVQQQKYMENQEKIKQEQLVEKKKLEQQKITDKQILKEQNIKEIEDSSINTQKNEDSTDKNTKKNEDSTDNNTKKNEDSTDNNEEIGRIEDQVTNETENKEQTKQELVDQTKEIKLTEAQQKQAEIQKENEKLIQQKIIARPSSFNSSLFTTLESIGDTIEKEKDELKQLGSYLKDDVIPAFMKKMNTDPLKNPVDQETLIQSIHELGINVRYLGQIYTLADQTKNIFLKSLVERTIFIRSIRKYFRKIAFEENHETFMNVLVQNLNMILGNDLVRDRLALKINNYLHSKLNGEQNQQNNQQHTKKKNKKSKNKKSKIRKLKLTTTSNINEWMLVTVDDFLTKILSIAESRYSFPTEIIKSYKDFSFLKTKNSKLSFLREISKAFGISFQQKNYTFDIQEDNFQYPIKLKNISNYYPTVKGVQFRFEALAYNQNTFDQLMQRKKYPDALNVLKTSQNMILNTYGIYHEEFIKTCKNISLVKFLQKKHDEAISVQLFAVKLCQKLYGLDHKLTAISLLELSNYLFDKKAFKSAIYFHSLSLYIFDLVASDYNPNSLYCLHELQIMTYGQKNYKLSAQYMQELLRRNEELHGETSERLIYILEKLASLKGLLKDFESASLLQARHYLILSRSFKKFEKQINAQYAQNMKIKLKESENLKNYYINQRNRLREMKKQ